MSEWVSASVSEFKGVSVASSGRVGEFVDESESTLVCAVRMVSDTHKNPLTLCLLHCVCFTLQVSD